MICPSCGANVPGDSLTCPVCRSPLDVTRKISLVDARWCPHCGALASPGAAECPKCGMPLEDEKRPVPERRTRDLDLPDIGHTGIMPALDDPDNDLPPITQIESAIPSEGEEALGSGRADRMPRMRALSLAGVLAVLVVGGAALLITHPWDPSATRISATTPADTSMQGFPGFVESLVGQDGGGSGEGYTTASEALEDAYESLGDLSSRIDQNEDLLRSTGVSSDSTREQREEGLETAKSISLEVSNLITEVTSLDDGSNSEVVDRLATLGNWLRNRCDALTSAWGLSVSSEDPAADSDDILAEVGASQDYRRRFGQSYSQWDPAGE